MMRRLRYALLVSVGVAMAPAPVIADPALNGMYIAQGTNPDGKEYRGLVHIKQRGESFVVSWIFPRASGEVVVLEASSIGVGMVSNGILAVSYYTPQTAGLAIYRIEDDGKRLAGQWTSVGDGGVLHVETLTRVPASEPAESAPPEEHQAPPTRRVPVPSGRVRPL